MERSLIEKIREYDASHEPTSLEMCFEEPRESYPTATVEAVSEAERALGFPIPAILKACYLSVGNGGFGPGYGVIGVAGGCPSNYGNLVETYELLKRDQESEGRQWPSGLLPFCEWGCNTYSCVACNDDRHPIYTFEDFAVHPQNQTLNTFFELWVAGADLFEEEPADFEQVEIINPFTGKKDTISKRRPK